ncbi:MAG: virulence factor [Actinobacteria bacterium]|nr:virulence factor [Actinomycetota bacterium]
MGELTVIWWRDIPAQVTAKAARTSARAQLGERFQEAIDAAAMSAGLFDSEGYLEEWRRERRACGDDLEAEVAGEAAKLEHAFDDDRLATLARQGGLADGKETE